jgi:hypothetical protein
MNRVMVSWLLVLLFGGFLVILGVKVSEFTTSEQQLLQVRRCSELHEQRRMNRTLITACELMKDQCTMTIEDMRKMYEIKMEAEANCPNEVE